MSFPSTGLQSREHSTHFLFIAHFRNNLSAQALFHLKLSALTQPECTASVDRRRRRLNMYELRRTSRVKELVSQERDPYRPPVRPPSSRRRSSNGRHSSARCGCSVGLAISSEPRLLAGLYSARMRLVTTSWALRSGLWRCWSPSGRVPGRGREVKREWMLLLQLVVE